MSSERFACRGGVLHRLWIYEVGPKLVIRNLAAANGGAPGLSLLDTGAQPNPLCPVTEPYPHALRPGPWRIEGSGRITLGVGRQRFVPGLCRLSATPVAIGLDGGSQPVRIALAALSSGAVGGPEVNVYDESGALWPTTGAIGTRRRAAGWRATWTSTTDSTSYITGVALSVAPLAEDDGASGADLLLTSADRECGLSIDGDRARERLVARIFDPGAGLAAYIRPNSHVRHAVDGVTRFRGLTDAAEWLSAAGGTPPTGQLVLRAQGLWKRFRHAHWPGGEPFDGRLLVDCLRDLAAAAGLAESELDLPDWDYRFPAPPDGVAAALDYRPGTTIDRILEDLRQKLLGAQAACYFRLSDGRFVLEPAPGAEPAATFHERAAEAAAAGEPEQVVQAGTYRETLDESELANIVTVIGRRCDGVPLVAQAVDFDSIGDPEAANYVGEPWPLEVFDPGLQSAAAVAYACRRLFERHRRARVLAIWRSVALPLCPGQTVALRGGLWRLDGLTASYGAEQPRGLCTYSAEALA